jgi:bifunctional non-homologous end joining protein LigD
MTQKNIAAKKSTAKASSAAVDDQLKRYRSMRNFDVTAEPSGRGSPRKPTSGLPFVIQKHAASHLHYDFRLAWNGVLKSWAVAKGPSYNTKDKRLAVQVEDHPIEYGGFEGIIPQGQYGGGTVMLWDEGSWEPQKGHEDVDAGLRDGSLKFMMHGTKMKGNWALIRMGGKAANEKKPNWLLIKEHDEFERGSDEEAVTNESPRSVVTGRSLEEIADNKDHVWNSKETAQGGKGLAKVPETEKTSGKVKAARQPDLDSYPKERMPKFVAPQLANQSEEPPGGPGWLHEIKLDGYRIQAHKSDGEVHLYTRTGLDWTHRMKEIAAQIARLAVDTAVFDGEVVVLAENGTSSFADLQAAFQDEAKHFLTYFVFDLLHLNGHNLREAPLSVRKSLLAAILAQPGDSIRFSEHLEVSGSTMFRSACELDAEGIVSKRASGKYKSGRTSDWVKTKCIHEQEFVIGGLTLPSTGAHGVGALLLGYYDDDGKLIYSGRTGTGFTQKTHRLLRDKVDTFRQDKSPFVTVPAEFRRGVIWIKPKLVAQVKFATWTADGLVRHASFKGLREDKPAKEVHREEVSRSSALALIASAAHKAQSTFAAKHVASSAGTEAKVEHAAVRLTHPDKVIDSETALTKQQLADYYWAIAEHMLPQISNRPLSLVRCPEGSSKPCFFQKHTNPMLPPGIEAIQIPDKKTGKLEPYITLSTREALAGLAQMGVLEVHPWGSQNDDLEHPDRIIIDLDPDEAIAWSTLAESATVVRKLFKELGLESFLKSTGGKGLHIVAPIKAKDDWTIIKQFAHSVALKLEKQQPSLYLSKMSKAARKNHIYVDYLRNERGATAVAAFSPRARLGAPVSVPLSWTELELPERPIYHVSDFEQWKSRLTKDPWKKLPTVLQKIDWTKAKLLLG